MVREYVGARYVPKFMGTYDNTQEYEALCVVDNGLGTSYITKVPTPAGTPLTNTTYWAVYGATSGAIINLQNQIDEITKIGATPQMYGAKADGVTDDTAAIQQALDENETVYIPASNYPYIFTQLILRENNHLIGMGGVLKYKDNTAVDSSQSYYPIWAIQDNIVIDGLIIDGNGSNNTQSLVCDCITISGRNSKVINCKIFDAPDSCITVSTEENLTVSHNNLDGAPDNGIYVNSSGFDNLKGFIISDNTICNCVNSAIACKRECSKGQISNNVIHDCTNGITMEPVSPYGSSTMIGISNNFMYNIAAIGIGIRGGVEHSVVGNTIKGSQNHAIQISGCKNCSIVGNVVSSSTTPSTDSYRDVLFIYGVGDENSSLSVIGNSFTINNSSLSGVEVIGHSHDITFSGNTFEFKDNNNRDVVICISAGGYNTENVIFSDNTCVDGDGNNHSINNVDIVTNNLGKLTPYQPTGADYKASACATMPWGSGTGQVRIMNPYSSINARNHGIFKHYDIVPDALTANTFKLYIANADGVGSNVLTELLSISGV